MKRLTLNYEEVTDAFLEDARLLGVVTNLANYRLCWALNAMYGYDFRANSPACIERRKRERKYFFSIHRHHKARQAFEHILYQNKDEGEYLLPELRHLDYIWMVKCDHPDDSLYERVRQQLLSLPDVQMVNEIGKNNLRNREFLLF